MSTWALVFWVKPIFENVPLNVPIFEIFLERL
jgi:hypothetical protein